MCIYQVKAEVAQRDQEMATLRELLDEEQVKKAKLVALMNQYSSTSTGNVEYSSTAQSSKLAPQSRPISRPRNSMRPAESTCDAQSQRTSRSTMTTTTISRTARK
jgi:hypothetical protein